MKGKDRERMKKKGAERKKMKGTLKRSKEIKQDL